MPLRHKSEIAIKDRFDILAEIKRQGLTLSKISIDAGLYEAAARQGVHGTSLKGAEAVAAALEIPFRKLFPKEKDYYPSYERRNAQSNPNDKCNKSSGRAAPVENREAAE